MKTLLSILILLLALPFVAFAGSKERGTRISTECCDEPERWGPRHDTADARLAIHTEDRASTLILTSEVVAVQLSDRAMRELRRKSKDEEDEDENALSRAIKSAVLSGVRSMLDHSAEVPLRQLQTADYRDGRLIFTTRKGERVLDGIDVNDRDVMESFSERDAKAFVHEFRRMKARS